jgi:MarR family transcriptional regulator, 2-MHQ and catechol-resistance regulon repressor
MASLSSLLQDPLAHRALDALVRAQSRLSRSLGHDLERHGLSVTGFSILVVTESAGGSLELRTLRQRLGISKANASEVAATLVARGLVERRRSARDARAVTLWLTPAGERTLLEVFPAHAGRVRDAFVPLEADEKRELARLCRKLDRAPS